MSIETETTAESSENKIELTNKIEKIIQDYQMESAKELVNGNLQKEGVVFLGSLLLFKSQIVSNIVDGESFGIMNTMIAKAAGIDLENVATEIKTKLGLHELKKNIDENNAGTENTGEKAPVDVTKKNVENLGAGISSAGVEELLKEYPKDRASLCLQEVRVFMQELARNGDVALPTDMNGEQSWGLRARDYGKSLREGSKNFPSTWDIKGFDQAADSVKDMANTIKSMKGDVFNIVMTEEKNEKAAGHICVAFRQEGEIVIFDNSFSAGADKGTHSFSLENYLQRRLIDGKYKLDAVAGIPLEQKFYAQYQSKKASKDTANA